MNKKSHIQKIPTSLTYSEAKEHRLTFGKYMGQTLENIAATHDGVEYLHWLYNEISGKNTLDTKAIVTFMESPIMEMLVEHLQIDVDGYEVDDPYFM